MIIKRPVRKWEKRWVLQPNVVEYGCDIWIQKWICVDNVNSLNQADLNRPVQQLYERVTAIDSIPNIE